MREPLARLPHEYPFRLADRVLERRGPGEGKVTATVTAGSFWGRAYPAALVGELIAQSALLLDGGDADLGRSGFLAGLSDVSVERIPEPGDVLTVDVRIVGRFGAVTRFAADVTLGEHGGAGGAFVGRGEVTVKKGASPESP